MNEIIYLSLFSGIGAFEKALTKQGIKVKLVNYCEIDKYASKAYSLIHNIAEDKNLGDVSQIDVSTLPDNIDLLTHGSPCQSYSIAGKQEGGDIGSGTKSSLMWVTVEIIKKKLPKIVVWENVKNILSPKHKHNFDKYLNDLSETGYNNYYKILNAKDYGIPQNRERIFVISIRNDVDNGKFDFPTGLKNEVKLKDILETNINEKYYLPQHKTEKLIEQYKQREKINDEKFAKQISDNNNNIIIIGRLDTINGHDILKRVYSTEGISPTLDSCSGGNRQPKILITSNNNMVVKGCSTRTRTYMGQPEQLEIRNDDLSNTITTVQKDSMVTDYYRIRKLTPLESFRLMGFDDQDYYILKQNNLSDIQLYKMAGNSIVVNVLEDIFKVLFK